MKTRALDGARSYFTMGLRHPLLFAGAILLYDAAAVAGDPLGVFNNQGDVGAVAKPGSASFDPGAGVYLVAGGGENMWATNDSFHFVWKKISGDFSFAAQVEWLRPGGNAHRKACLVVRQTLAPDSPYIDVALHGDGLTSLQFREEAGGLTREVRTPAKGPKRIGLERVGDAFVALTGSDTTPLGISGAFHRLHLADPVYVGLGVCAHDDHALEQARFTALKLETATKPVSTNLQLHCALEILPLASRDRRVVYHTTNHIEAPNWSRDGHYLLFNSKGGIFRMPAASGELARVDTGFATRCNNDHGLSPDGSLLAISDQSEDGKSRIYVLPAKGGTPGKITPLGPSYWHGWSPDGKTLAYCAERNGEFDVYTIPAAGGEEKRITTAKGLDDGPDYSPDGQWIYFNSDRTGSMHVWRMRPDGSEQQQLTSDELNDWFPHPSPDGKWLVFVSYAKDVRGHPANQPVSLRILPAAGGKPEELIKLFGGQGTLNVPSWSPDSRELAFVSYELLPR